MTALIICLSVLGVIIVATVIAGIICNHSLMLTEIGIESEHLPEEFDGFRIAHISDLHNARFGKDNTRLVKLISNSKPDIIAITGDLIDSRHTDKKTALSFASKTAKIAPTYYVTGNHESRFDDIDDFLQSLSAAGLRVLRNETVILTRGNGRILIVGAEDPALAHSKNFPHDNDEVVEGALSRMLTHKQDVFTLLLCHRPELFDIYSRHKVNLALTGHAHGGQIRLPILGGLFAPKQGFLPKYTSGATTRGSTSMIVSRGLGNSLFPIRLFNTPEVVLVTLRQK